MSLAARYPQAYELLISVAVLLGSYLAARVVSHLIARAVDRIAKRTHTTLDDRLAAAFKRPLTWALFLVGAYAATHRLALPASTQRWIDSVLFAGVVLLLAVAVLQSYGLLLHWYVSQPRVAASSALAAEFGPLISKVGKVFIAVVTVTILLQHFGVNVQSLVVSLGVGSLAIGLAAQDTLANMFGGFTLMLDRPFRVGDRIQLATGEVGDVEAIGMRATRIRTTDEMLLVVPNSALVKDRVINFNLPSRALTTKVEVDVAYGSDLQAALQVLAEAARAVPLVDHDREPAGVVKAFGDGSVVLALSFWVRDYLDQGAARSAVLAGIHERLRAAGIERPLPARRVVGEAAAEAPTEA
jgi:MscS family membrane protein